MNDASRVGRCTIQVRHSHPHPCHAHVLSMPTPIIHVCPCSSCLESCLVPALPHPNPPFPLTSVVTNPSPHAHTRRDTHTQLPRIHFTFDTHAHLHEVHLLPQYLCAATYKATYQAQPPLSLPKICEFDELTLLRSSDAATSCILRSVLLTLVNIRKPATPELALHRIIRRVRTGKEENKIFKKLKERKDPKTCTSASKELPNRETRHPTEDIQVPLPPT